MKLTRRPDLDPQTRIKIVNLAWLYQGVYGKMTKIAQQYQISRTFLYRLLLMATVQLETLFRDEKRLVQNDPRHFAPLLFLLRLEGHCSLLSIAASCKRWTTILIPSVFSVSSSTRRARHFLPPS